MTKRTPAKIISSYPEAIIYTHLKLPLEISVGDSLSEELGKLILLEVQGEAVEVSEEYSLPILMAAFDIIHKVSPEMILISKSGKRVLIFEHWSKPMLRDEDIIAINETKTVIHKKEDEESQGFVAELIIDLTNIWKIGTQEDNLEAIKKALKKIETSIKPSMTVTLTGKAPVLIYLLAQHLLYGKTGEIWYQENLASQSIRIARL